MRGSDHVSALLDSSGFWLDSAFDALEKGQWERLAVSAGIFIEHVGKAVLWSYSPCLLAPMTNDPNRNVQAMIALAGPDARLDAPGLRTIGLAEVLRRLRSLGVKTPDHIADYRNGVVHVGLLPGISSDEGKRIRGQTLKMFTDTLALCNDCLSELDEDPRSFYGPRTSEVSQLVGQRESWVMRQVQAKIADAHRRLATLEDEAVQNARRAMGQTPATITDDGVRVHQECPACRSSAWLYGEDEIEEDIDYEAPEAGDGSYGIPYVAGYTLAVTPTEFKCFVCGLHLDTSDELEAAKLPAKPYDVDDSDVGDIDLQELARLHHESENIPEWDGYL